MALVPWKHKEYDPFRELSDMSDGLFGLTLFPGADRNLVPFRGGWPAIDVSEDKNNVIIKADLPGLKQEEIEINMDNDILTIKGERRVEEEKKDKNYHRVERSYGAFERSLQLGVAVDKEKIKAAYKNGVLEVILPKTEQVKPKQIKIDVE